MTKGNVWTDELVRAFAKLHRSSDETFSEMAKQLSTQFNIELSRNALIGKARRLDLPTRKPEVVRKPLQGKKQVIPTRRVDAPIEHVEPPVPLAPSEEPVDGPRGGPLTIYQLRYGVCRWPLGSQLARPPYLYCGDPTLDGKPYCGCHYVAGHIHARAS